MTSSFSTNSLMFLLLMTITYQRGKSLPSKTTDKESKRTLKTARKILSFGYDYKTAKNLKFSNSG